MRPDIDESAEFIENMRAVRIGEGRIAAVLPCFFEFLIAERHHDGLPQAQWRARVGQVIQGFP
jgi:hypothetical protein